MTEPAAAAIPRALTMRDLAIQASETAKLNSFAAAYDIDPSQVRRIEASFAKTCSQATKLTNICNSSVVKQLCFLMPNFKLGILTNPVITQNAEGNDIIVGSLGDSMDVIHPVTIRLQDATADIISICTSRAIAEKFKFALSTTNPIEETGPPPPADSVTMPEPPGPDRIHIVIDNPDNVPCFVAMPKVFPLTGGFSVQNNPTISATPTINLPNHAEDSLINTWYRVIRYGSVYLENYSLQSRDTLFVYAELDTTELAGPNRVLASRCTVHVDALDFDSPNYNEVVDAMRKAKEEAHFNNGSKILAEQGLPAPSIPLPSATVHAAAPAVMDPAGMQVYFQGLTKALNDSKSLTGTERERATEAADAARFYSILFASSVDIIQEDGTTAATIVPATINPLFTPVLTANKNSKATRAMQDGIEAISAELSNLDDKFASAANLLPTMFDQPLVAAIRTGQWEHQKTVINPDGTKTKVGLHHLAPPRTNSAAYRSRQEGESLLVQQEQVEEDRSRQTAKTTELYFGGRMYTLTDTNESLGNLFGLMCLIIEYNPRHPPILWQELTKFDKIFRTREGRKWCDLHRNSREIMFNVFQELQSVIAGFVNEARKQGYKNLVATGTVMSAQIFTDSLLQSERLLNNLTGTVLTMSAGTYKDSTMLYKIFNPEEEKKRKQRGGDNGDDSATNSTGTSSGTSNHRQRTNSRPTTVTPSGSPGSAGSRSTRGPPGKTVLMHTGSPPPMSLPHPGPIFPNCNSQPGFTILCCRSAYVGRDCTTPNCKFFHFPDNLSSVSRALKDKLRAFVANQSQVQWHGDAVSWAGAEGTATSAPRRASNSTPAS